MLLDLPAADRRRDAAAARAAQCRGPRGITRSCSITWAGATSCCSRPTAPAGKRIRPMLCLLACEAAGGDPHAALPAAAGLELLHNFSLIHDDIEDDSHTRRHRPTAWSLWGVPIAINAGDGMFSLAHAGVLRPGGPRRARRGSSRRVAAVCRNEPGADRRPVHGYDVRGPAGRERGRVLRYDRGENRRAARRRTRDRRADRRRDPPRSRKPTGNTAPAWAGRSSCRTISWASGATRSRPASRRRATS